LRAQLLQMLYSIRSERLLMEEMDYNLLFRWFVGLNADDKVWDATTFTKNRDRLLEADVAKEFLARESVQGYVTWLAEMKFSPSTINQRLAAIRKLASEAQRCGYVDSEKAQAIVTVAGVSQKGRRLGRWLAWEEARTLLQAPNPHSIRGTRDRALLAVLVTCALRRGELSRMNCEHLAMRDGRWVFLDFMGKGSKVRSVAVPICLGASMR
jgi:site-specific recombinase XerD